jgi:protein-tyrosine phosphatase
MAEGLLKKYLSEALGCEPEALPERGFTIVSAGVRPISGAPASEGARAVMRTFGVDLDDHAAQAVSPQLAQAADRILVMTREHQELVAGLWPATAGRIQRLGGDRDVVDPFGGNAADYEAAAGQIAAAMRALAAELKARAVSADK